MSQTTETAKQQAAGVGQSAAGAGQHVAATAKDEASNVVAEAASQARDVVGTARDELTRQAADQQQKLASGLRNISRELSSMADKSEDPGYATDLARQASSTVDDVAGWLENRDGSALLEDVKSFARRRPGAFIAFAVGAGVLAGRLTRDLKDEASSSSSTRSSSTPASSTPAPYAGTTGTYSSTTGDLPSYGTETYGSETYGSESYSTTTGTGTVTGTTTGTTGYTAAGPYDTVAADDPYAPVDDDVIIVTPPVGESTGREGRP